MSQKYKYILSLFIVFILGTFLRLWHVEFGLPHSFYADEPEIVELAVKYTFELKSIVLENNWYKLVPISYVYGTFPVYFLTPFTILFSKVSNLINFDFDKANIYVFLRGINGTFSLLILPAIAYLYYRMFKDKVGALITFFLLAFNWKLIVHAHYVNPDIFITILLSLSYLTLFLYHTGKKNTLYTVLTGILFGLSVGTKITALITLPLYVFIFYRKKDFRDLLAFLFLVFGAFIASNPFSIIFANDFTFRIYSMLFKEAGLVFDSVDPNPFKYMFGLSWISTLPVLLGSVWGMFNVFKKQEKHKDFNIFLVGNVLVYMLFYSIQSRRVDRWLLPILPIVMLYVSYGGSLVCKYIHSKRLLRDKIFGVFIVVISLIYYLYFSWVLLNQFQRNTPKSASYIWMQENAITRDPFKRTLAYTEEGIDPLNKLPYADVYQFNVYEGDGAFLFYPADPYLYKYVILSSRPMENFKRLPVMQKYPEYSKHWSGFETTLNNSGDFTLIKTFNTTTPNLIPLSKVFVYENTKL